MLLANTLLLGATIMAFSRVGSATSLWAIVALSFLQGFLSSIQFTSVNTLVYADVDDREASKAGSIASTALQLSLSFGVAIASLAAGWFMGRVHQSGQPQTVVALHHAFVIMGVFTFLSSAAFGTLHRNDGRSVSNYRAPG